MATAVLRGRHVCTGHDSRTLDFSLGGSGRSSSKCSRISGLDASFQAVGSCAVPDYFKREMSPRQVADAADWHVALLDGTSSDQVIIAT